MRPGLNTPTWCDLSAYRPATARGFYAAVMGWEIPKDAYAMARNADGPVAGLYEMPRRFQDMRLPSFWMSYFAVRDLGDCVATVMAEGGKVEFIEGWQDGRVAFVRDPLGAGFTLYQGDLAPGVQGKKAGARLGHTLVVSDAGVSDFYKALMGWDAQAIDGGWHFTLDGTPVADLMEAPPENRNGYEFWALTFAVTDMQAAAHAVMQKKGRVFGETDFPVGPVVGAADMDGAAFFLVAAEN